VLVLNTVSLGYFERLLKGQLFLRFAFGLHLLLFTLNGYQLTETLARYGVLG